MLAELSFKELDVRSLASPGLTTVIIANSVIARLAIIVIRIRLIIVIIVKMAMIAIIVIVAINYE